jgi:peptidyl-prolyl cis-trans isomerase D
MFDQMRKNTKTILWITVAAFIGLIFLGWGLQFSGAGKNNKQRDPSSIGSVNGVPVATRDYEAAINNTRARYQGQTGRDLDDRTEVMIRNQSWNDLVQEMLMRQEIEKRRITVSDQEVVSAVLNNPPPEVTQSPNFQTNGKFDLAKYQAALRDPNVDTRAMEEQYRSSLPLQKLQMQVVGSVAISDGELYDAWLAQNEKLKVSFLMFPGNKFTVDEASIGQADLDRYYQAHKSSYKQQPAAVLEYVVVPRHYTDQDSLNLIEQGHSIVQELKGGEDFMVLMDAYSEAGPAMRGGDQATFFTAAQIADPRVREAITSLAVGGSSDAILAGNGVHVVKLLDKKADPAGDQFKFADVYLSLKPSPETLTQLRDRAQEFRTEVAKRRFTEVASEMKLSAHQTQPFTESGFVPGLGSAPELQDFAFRNPVGAISPPIERAEGWYVARVSEKHEARVADLKEVQDRVRQEFADSLRVDQAAQAAQSLFSRAQAGTPLAQLATADPRVTYDTTDLFPRLGFPKGIGADPSVIGPLFAGGQNGLFPRVLHGRTAAFILSVDARITPDKAQFEAQKMQQRQNLLQRKQSELMNDWLAQLRKNAKIEDYRFGLFD